MNTENGLPLLTPTLLAATGLLVVSLVLLFWLSINFTGELDFEPARVSGASYKFIQVPQPHDGPVSITIEFEVNRIRGRGVPRHIARSSIDSLAEWRVQLAPA